MKHDVYFCFYCTKLTNILQLSDLINIKKHRTVHHYQFLDISHAACGL